MHLCVTAVKREMGNEMACFASKALCPQYQEPLKMWYDHYSSMIIQQASVLNSTLEN